MTDYAKLGTHTLLRRAHIKNRTPGASQAIARPGSPVIGWTAPTIIYDKMRHIDAGAKELNALMLANVRDPTLLAAWRAWYTQWLAFFDKYQGMFAKLGAVFYTDELATQTEGYRSTYESFRASYALQRDPNGLPLPQAQAPIPAVLTPGETKKEDGSSSGITIPWWIWALGGVGLTVGGYFLYKNLTRTAHELRAKRRALDSTLPTLLQGYGVPKEITQAGVATDPSRPRPAATVLAPSEIYVDVVEVEATIPRHAHRDPRERHHESSYDHDDIDDHEPSWSRSAASRRDPE